MWRLRGTLGIWIHKRGSPLDQEQEPGQYSEHTCAPDEPSTAWGCSLCREDLIPGGMDSSWTAQGEIPPLSLTSWCSWPSAWLLCAWRADSLPASWRWGTMYLGSSSECDSLEEALTCAKFFDTITVIVNIIAPLNVTCHLIYVCLLLPGLSRTFHSCMLFPFA